MALHQASTARDASEDRPATPPQPQSRGMPESPGPDQVTPLKLPRRKGTSASAQLAASDDGCQVAAQAADSAEVVPEWPFVAPPPGLQLDGFETASRDMDHQQSNDEVGGINGVLSDQSPSPDAEERINGHARKRGGRRSTQPSSPATQTAVAAQNVNPSQRGAGTRPARILQQILESLSCEEAASWKDREGYVSISKLLRVRPELQRDAFGSSKVIAQAVEGSGTVRLDQERKRVRLQTEEELLRSVAVQHVDASPHGAVPVSFLLSLPVLRQALSAGRRKGENQEGVLRRALSHEESEVAPAGKWITRRPRPDQLQRAMEELFSDSHLAQDQRLRGKIADTQNGEVPLTWLSSKYAERLGSAPATGARAAEVTAAELCEALRHSEVVAVDIKRLTVRRKAPLKLHATPAGGEGGQGHDTPQNGTTLSPAARSPSGATSAEKNRSAGAARAASQLRQLLDFYFEPFTLQHNRYLLDLLARRIGPPAEAGPWVAEALLDFCFGIEDLRGLGRISSALSKLKGGSSLDVSNGVQDLVRNLKHLRSNTEGLLQLRSPPEIRSFVTARTAAPAAAEAAARYLTAAKEQRGEAPVGMLSVFSYAVTAALAEDSEKDQQRLARLKRQLLLHHADLVCLQGLDADVEPGAGLAATLSEEGYGFATARSPDLAQANTIFYDRSRWECLQTKVHGSVLAVDLAPFEEPSGTLRVICFRPDLSSGSGMRHIFDGPDLMLVCADLTSLGGAEGASIVEELAGLPSVSQEVLGGELRVPLAVPGVAGQDATPVRGLASGLNRLHSPDAVLFRNMLPTVALSGHTEGYLATMSSEDLHSQFPALRMPIVAAFDRRKSYAPEGFSTSEERDKTCTRL